MSDDKKQTPETQKPEEQKTQVKPGENKEEVKTDKKEAKKKVNVSPKLKNIIEEIEKLSVLELADLVKALEEKFGVTAAAPAAAPAVAQAAGAPAEEKTEFNVILAAGGANKIAAIKAVREIKPDMGLKDAKDLVEAAPKELLKGANKKDAEEAKAKLEAAGCQVELK